MNIWRKRKNLLCQKANDGYSLLELIIAVAVLAILVVLGVLFFRGLNDNAKQSTVDNAAATVFKSVLTKSTDPAKYGNPLDADEEWMNSAGEDNKITVDVASTGDGQYEVRAHYGDDTFENSSIKALKRTVDSEDTGTDPGDTENPGGIIGADPLLSSFTFVCDETTTGILPISNIDINSTEVSITANSTTTPVNFTDNVNGMSYVQDTAPSSVLKNIASPITMNAGTTYTLEVNGSFETIASIQGSSENLGGCITSVNSLGQESGLKHFNDFDSIESSKLQSVPNSIPSTVVSLTGLFQQSKQVSFANSLKSWDVSNVEDVRQLFNQASINGDLDLSRWNTAKVKNMDILLYGAEVSGSLIIDGLRINNLSTSSPLLNGTKAANLQADNIQIDNVVFGAPMFSGSNFEKASLNNWEIKNSSVYPPLFSGITLNGDLNNWKIINSIVNAPIISGSFNGNANNWELREVNDTTIMFSKFAKSNVRGSTDGWTVNGSPID